MGIDSKAPHNELYGVEYAKYNHLRDLIADSINGYCESFVKHGRIMHSILGRGYYAFEFDSIEEAYEFNSSLIAGDEIKKMLYAVGNIDSKNEGVANVVNTYDPDTEVICYFKVKLSPDETIGDNVDFVLILQNTQN